jgi:molybdopterin synthase catalytic subunit
MSGVHVEVGPAPISRTRAERRLAASAWGAVVLFTGHVRPDRRPGGRVVALDYEADRVMAKASLASIGRRALQRFSVGAVVLT